jgi:rare lipoprotein A
MIASAAILAAGCGAARRDMREPLEPQHVAVGIASWYGAAFAGRPTASGEIFDPRKLTAAHRTLPLGSMVQVTNMKNGRSVVVRINDRGPFKPGRILDCSEGAARALGFRGRGMTDVAIDWPDSPAARQATKGEYWLQLGAFESMTAARRLRTRVAPVANSVADSVAVHRDPDLLRVHAGPYGRRKNAEKALTRLQEAGFDGIIVVLDSRVLTPVP